MLTAVGVSSLTGVTTLAVHIRLDGTAVSRHHILNLRSDIDDLDSQLVPWDPRVAKKRKFSEIAAIVGSTYSYTTNGHQRFVGGRHFRLTDVYQTKMLRFL